MTTEEKLEKLIHLAKDDAKALSASLFALADFIPEYKTEIKDLADCSLQRSIEIGELLED